MKLLITGANGNFNQSLIPKLADAGHELVLLDLEPVEAAGHAVVQADIRDAGAVTAAMRGCDGVLHAAGYHDNMARRRNDDDYFAVNVGGTHNVLTAMTRMGVRNLVYTSTVGVYGVFARPDSPVRVIDESTPLDPPNIYYANKVMCETYCDFFAAERGLRVAKLRCSCFVPASWRQTGTHLLQSRVAREDVATAHRLAIEALAADRFACEAMNIHADTPFTPGDWPDLLERPADVLERYWPGSPAVLARYGLEPPAIRFQYDIRRAKRLIGYQPRYNFPDFLTRLQAEPASSAT